METNDRTENDTGDLGAEGGDASPSADALPASPTKDGTPLGDTDQHSSAEPGEHDQMKR